MFRLELSDNSIFKNAFESVSSIIDETVCIIDEEGFRLRAMDRSHITFVTLELKPEIFDEFECPEPEKICVDTNELMKILKRCKNNDLLRLKNDEGNLIIEFIGDSEREFKIRLIDVDYETPEPPTVPYNSSVTLPSGMVKDFINDMDLFSDALKFMFDEDYFYVKSDGEFGDSEVKYLHGESINEVVDSNFNIEKLKDIFRASKFSENVEICLGDNMPVTINFNIGDEGHLGFLLAPRLEQEE